MMRISSPENHAISQISLSVLRILAYFDIFDHPLTTEEIRANCDHAGMTKEALQHELDELTRRSYVYTFKGYYFLGHSSCVHKRENEADRYRSYLKKAFAYSCLISWFPFVRGICISGSLSKGRADKDSDIDYFIITAPGRLWICRTLLTIFKKIFLLNSRKYFCINYFVDTDHLEIPDKNIFTATEVAFLIPTYHYENYKRFMRANSWVKEYYPNKPLARDHKLIKKQGTWSEKIELLLFPGWFGSFVENSCLKLTRYYRRKKFHYLSDIEFHHRLRTAKGSSKHHPNSFQSLVLNAYDEKIIRLLNSFEARA